MDVTDAVAVVTGGASGIGAATVRALAAAGARCTILDRDEARGEAIAAEVGGDFLATDVSDEAQVRQAVEAAAGRGPIRVLVNVAGIGGAARVVDRLGAPFPLETFERVLRINLIGSFNCLRLVAAAMTGNEPVGADGVRGVIVNIASIAAFDGQIGQAAYSASKGGIVGMTLPIARDLASYGIRVNTVAPGLIDTPIYGEGERGDSLRAALQAHLLYPKRLGEAHEVASMILELVRNDYVNGETIRVDAGVRLGPR